MTTRQRRSQRIERVPFGVARRKLTIDSVTAKRLEAEQKVPRWINDEAGRIQAAEAGDYEFVTSRTSAVQTGDGKEVNEQDRKIRAQVGEDKDGSPKYAYLMAIPKEFYEEDQAAKEAHNRMVDDAIRGGTLPGVEKHNIPAAHGGTSIKTLDYTP